MTPTEHASRAADELKLYSLTGLTQEVIIGNLAEHISSALRDLLRLVGTPGRCKGCARSIFWVRHLGNPSPVPYSQAGINHFIDCPEADKFRQHPELAQPDPKNNRKK